MVVEQLEKTGEVSRNWALRNYISRLSAIIYDLRHGDEWEIDGEFRESTTIFGKGKDYVYIWLGYKDGR